MASIGAGGFAMGSDSGGSWERPVHTVRTPAFEISARPVSNAEYRLFRPSHQSPGDDGDGAPVTGVSWDDARAYCDWLSAGSGLAITLPTEARWERAARGGLEQKKYPWGDQPTPDGSERANPWGVYAVTYMLWEWTSDWYKGTYYAESPAEDPGGPSEGVYRVLRGGGYRNDPASATVYTRGSARPETRSERITFRVTRALGGPPPVLTSAAPASLPTSAVSRPAPIVSPQGPAANGSPAVQTASPPQQSPPPLRQTPPAPRKSAPAPTSSAATPGSDSPGGPVEVSGVTFTEESGEIVVKLATTGPALFKAFALKEPERLVLDVLEGTATLKPGTGTVQVGRNGVKAVRYSQFQPSPPIFRTVIDLEAAKNYRVEAWPGELRIRLMP